MNKSFIIQTSLWVLVGGGLGSLLRYWITLLFHQVLKLASFPWAILLINIAGSFLIAFLSVWVFRRSETQIALWQSFLLIGILGGFTTFSTFSLDAVNLFLSGRAFAAMTYISASVLLSLLAAFLGLFLAY